MRKILLLLLAVFSLNSCMNEDTKTIDGTEMNSSKTTLDNDFTMGQLHNQGLDEMYNYLSRIENLNRSNVNEYSQAFLSERYGSQASDFYMQAINSFDFTRNLPREVQNEIQGLYNELDIRDFNNMEEFKIFMDRYAPRHISNRQNLEIWNYYKDVFTHSFEYWAENIERWESLNPRDSMFLLSVSSEGKGWFGRLWGKVKKYVGVDAGAAATYVTIGLVTGGPIGIGAGAGASLGASAGAVFKDLFL